jgi:hypothetical protein
VIEVYGDWLPRYIDVGIFTRMISRSAKSSDRRFTAICGIIRMLYLSLVLFIKTIFGPDGIGSGHIVFLDGLSQSIPIISACGLPVLFYCHFPDALLSPINVAATAGASEAQAQSSSSHSSFVSKLQRLYRDLVDWLEEATMEQAALIAGNIFACLPRNDTFYSP